MIDAAQQRKTMVESQVRPSDVTDRRIIRAMLDTPREAFVPAALRSLAYMDTELKLPAADRSVPPRALMAPRVLSKLLQLASIEPGDVVLDVGAATGYSAAVIAKLAETVVALEVDDRLADEATQALSRLQLDNVAVVKGALGKGYPQEGPYDAIILEGSVPDVPQGLLEQLNNGGRLVVVIGDGAFGNAVVYQRNGPAIGRTIGFDAGAPPLPGFETPRPFKF